MLLFFKPQSGEYPRYENQSILVSWVSPWTCRGSDILTWDASVRKSPSVRNRRQMVQLVSYETRWALGERVLKADKGIIICLI